MTARSASRRTASSTRCARGGQPQKVKIEIVADKLDRDVVRRLRTGGATEISPSPTGKEVAFVMGGDVYVTSVDYRTTRQITSTQDQERGVQFSPDGRSIVYASERDGLWQIYEATIADKEEKQFTYATDIRERNLTNSKVASFQPAYSPDGKEVAFLEDRTAIRVVNLKSGKVRTAMEGKWQYSYADGVTSTSSGRPTAAGSSRTTSATAAGTTRTWCWSRPTARARCTT